MLTDEQIAKLAQNNIRECGGFQSVIEGVIRQALELDAKPKPLRCPFCGAFIIIRHWPDYINEEWVHPEANCILSNMANITKSLWNMRVKNSD